MWMHALVRLRSYTRCWKCECMRWLEATLAVGKVNACVGQKLHSLLEMWMHALVRTLDSASRVQVMVPAELNFVPEKKVTLVKSTLWQGGSTGRASASRSNRFYDQRFKPCQEHQKNVWEFSESKMCWLAVGVPKPLCKNDHVRTLKIL